MDKEIIYTLIQIGNDLGEAREKINRVKEEIEYAMTYLKKDIENDEFGRLQSWAEKLEQALNLMTMKG